MTSPEGADDGFSAVSLEDASSLSPGWRSRRYCSWPQEVIIAFPGMARLRRIQLLSHENMIATRVRLAVGVVRSGIDKPTYDQAEFKALGHVSFSDNSATSHASRELKSVHVDAVGCFLRLRFEKNHVNRLNLFNQVGLVALNVVGDGEFGGPVSAPHNGHSLAAPPRSLDSTLGAIGRDQALMDVITSGRINNAGMAQLLEEFAPLPSETLTPAALGLINRPVAIDAAEDLEFTMNVDPDTARRIRELGQDKERAIAAEDYRRAAQIKHAISVHSRAGVELFRLAREKLEAVKNEDYDLAHALKEDISRLRAEVEAELAPRVAPTANPRRHGSADSIAATRQAASVGILPQTPPLPSIAHRGASSVRASTPVANMPGPAPLPPIGSARWETRTPPPVSPPARQSSPPTRPPPASPPLPARRGKMSSPPAVASAARSPRAADSVALAETPAIAEAASRPARNARRDHAAAAAATNVSFDDQPVGKSTVRLPPEQAPKAGKGGGPARAPVATGVEVAPLSGPQRAQLASAISVFGEACVAQLCSKAWQHKDAALVAVAQEVGNGIPGASTGAACEALGQVLDATSTVRVKKVMARLMTVVQATVRVYLPQLGSSASGSLAAPLIQPMVAVLLAQCGEAAPEVRSTARGLLIELLTGMAAGIAEEVGAVAQCFAPLPRAVAFRQAVGVLELASALVDGHGLADAGAPAAPARLDAVMALAGPLLRHARTEVRTAALETVVQCYRRAGRRVIDLARVDATTEAALAKTLQVACAAATPIAPAGGAQGRVANGAPKGGGRGRGAGRGKPTAMPSVATTGKARGGARR